MCYCARVCAAVQQVQDLESLGQRYASQARKAQLQCNSPMVFIVLQQGSPASVSTSIDYLFWLVVHQCVWSDGMRDDGVGRPLTDPFVVRRYQRADDGSRITRSHSLRPGLN